MASPGSPRRRCGEILVAGVGFAGGAGGQRHATDCGAVSGDHRRRLRGDGERRRQRHRDVGHDDVGRRPRRRRWRPSSRCSCPITHATHSATTSAAVGSNTGVAAGSLAVIASATTTCHVEALTVGDRPWPVAPAATPRRSRPARPRPASVRRSGSTRRPTRVRSSSPAPSRPRRASTRRPSPTRGRHRRRGRDRRPDRRGVRRRLQPGVHRQRRQRPGRHPDHRGRRPRRRSTANPALRTATADVGHRLGRAGRRRRQQLDVADLGQPRRLHRRGGHGRRHRRRRRPVERHGDGDSDCPRRLRRRHRRSAPSSRTQPLPRSAVRRWARGPGSAAAPTCRPARCGSWQQRRTPPPPRCWPSPSPCGAGAGGTATATIDNDVEAFIGLASGSAATVVQHHRRHPRPDRHVLADRQRAGDGWRRRRRRRWRS